MIFDFNFEMIDGLWDCSTDVVYNDKLPQNTFSEGTSITGSSSSASQSINGSVG